MIMAGDGMHTLLVAAIDFGTTYSGYAFSFRHEYERDPLKISTNTSWTTNSGLGLVSWKTPTTVLLGPNQDFVAFGYEAEERYIQLAENDEHKDWYYFQHFKMQLYNKLCLKRNILIQDAMGKAMPAEKIFTSAIRFLKDHLLHTISNRGIEFSDNDILWILTVPAVWNEPAKQFMREAAVEAGLKSELLKLALEPEAASVYCKTVPIERSQMEGAMAQLGPFSPETRYMVLDLGGGTVDVTVHEVKADGTLKELHKASGGDWGGIQVDKHYFYLYDKIFGKELMDIFKKDFKFDHLDMQRDFEIKKRNLHQDSVKVSIKVPAALLETVQKEKQMSPQQVIEAAGMSEQMSLKRDRFTIDAQIIRDMFVPLITNIIQHVKDVMHSVKLQTLDKILLVGGFSESPFVRQLIKAAFLEIPVTAPDEPGLAVLKGAVIFGHSPNSISSRVSRYTYGVATQGPFIKGRHPEDLLIKVEDQFFCKNLFSAIIRMDTSIDDGEFIGREYDITDPTSSVQIHLFASTKPYPIMVTDEGCMEIGKIMINPPIGGFQKAAKFKVQLGFGGTEFRVKATEVNTQQEQEAKFDFLS